ncbi:DUF2254 family protein [Actinoplanes sp. RD1]|uniref:DUF2254 family protein n=1 Tax=Actinoplanes sp. RD1 TaxID=3064538 RepID=UPI0027411910|nr:DUF2254 family protein [Actinoplanes sp. RD1]
MTDSGPTMVGTRLQRRWQHLRRGLRDFVAVPLLVITGFMVLAVLSIIGDRTHAPVLDAVRSATQKIIGDQAATTTLQAIATALVTVTSITFSMLLLAVQQTAASLSPVVFDQFVRRRANQGFLGFFVGLAIFACIVMAAVRDDTPPVLAAATATLLTGLALTCLLVLVYTTIAQMRPANVLRQLHDRALRAHRRERDLIRRTRRRELSTARVGATCRCDAIGYVIGIDLECMTRALARVPGAEIRLHIVLGQTLAYGDVIATVRHEDERAAQGLADEVRVAVLIDTEPDLNTAGTGIDSIANIAWTSASTAQQNPEVARQALHTLRDLAARWIEHEAVPPGDDAEDRLPIVYPDGDLDRILQVLYSMLVAAQESHQHLTAAHLLETYETLLSSATGEVAERLRDDVTRARPLLADMPASPVLQRIHRRLDPSSAPY